MFSRYILFSSQLREFLKNEQVVFQFNSETSSTCVCIHICIISAICLNPLVNRHQKQIQRNTCGIQYFAKNISRSLWLIFKHIFFAFFFERCVPFVDLQCLLKIIIYNVKSCYWCLMTLY